MLKFNYRQDNISININSYPKILICCLTRINKEDVFNGNLLLRNLFTDWPCERLAQIYSGGSNGDEGFCKYQYQIAACDRQLGNLFFKLKGSYKSDSITYFGDSLEDRANSSSNPIIGKIKSTVGSFIMDSGLYELLFMLRPSKQLIDWVEAFQPDIILAQGYNLTFTWLPVLLKKRLNKPLAYFSSDDWPSYLYSSSDGLLTITALLMRRLVKKATAQLFSATDVPFSFNDVMGEDYEQRYEKQFTTLMHCDDPDRFKRALPVRLHRPEIKSIIATGSFDDSRWPLLLDLDEACLRLNEIGIQARAIVLTTRISEKGFGKLKSCRFVKLQDDPGHDLLPSYLKGADLLYLPETFDPEVARGYRYSISTKAHLFMFSQRPILVYGHPDCGLVNYAKHEGWAMVVGERNIDMLVDSLHSILLDDVQRVEKIQIADKVVMHNNDCVNVRAIFRANIISACPNFKLL